MQRKKSRRFQQSSVVHRKLLPTTLAGFTNAASQYQSRHRLRILIQTMVDPLRRELFLHGVL